MPTRGHFVLHSQVLPDLKAGDYVLEGDQSASVAEARFAPYRGHVRVTSPRYRLPPDQILSTFPPANAEGSFETRLPQVVLKRRTLPWERGLDPADDKVPWLALVVIAEGEGELSGETPVADCVTPGVELDGPNDVANGVYLSVPQRVVDKVFPTAEDLPLLAHVREVDLDDTELAMGDDDGFLAVVLANRMPQFDRAAQKPVRYLACLINLEGQLDALPEPVDPVEVFVADAHVFDTRAVIAESRVDGDLMVMGTGQAFTAPQIVEPFRDASHGRAEAARASAAAGPAFESAQTHAHHSASVSGTVQEWATRPRDIDDLAVSAAPTEAARVVRDAMGAAFRIPWERFSVEKAYRFPVLAHWSFTVTGSGSFEAFLRELDVGLLGTEPNRDQPAPPAGVRRPPPAPPSRPPAELAETGHVGLAHQTRRGEQVRAWYRGPLTPHVVARRQPDEDRRLALPHTSDQLRRLVPDGREDLALAAAFEIGRLLALSQPSVVAALMRWRREQFGAARARRLAERAAIGLDQLAPAFDTSLVGEIGALIGRELVLAAAADPARILAPRRPLVDPGRPLELPDSELDQLLADGFGIPRGEVAKLRKGDLVSFSVRPVPIAESSAEGPLAGIERLRAGLAAAVGELATQTLGGRIDPGRGAGLRSSDGASRAGADDTGDELDKLIARANGSQRNR